MIISSEKTGKTYKTVQACLEDEAAFEKAQEEKRKAEEEKQRQLDEAYEDAMKACEKYLNLAGYDIEIKTQKAEDEGEDDFVRDILKIIFC